MYGMLSIQSKWYHEASRKLHDATSTEGGGGERVEKWANITYMQRAATGQWSTVKHEECVSTIWMASHSHSHCPSSHTLLSIGSLKRCWHQGMTLYSYSTGQVLGPTSNPMKCFQSLTNKNSKQLKSAFRLAAYTWPTTTIKCCSFLTMHVPLRSGDTGFSERLLYEIRLIVVTLTPLMFPPSAGGILPGTIHCSLPNVLLHRVPFCSYLSIRKSQSMEVQSSKLGRMSHGEKCTWKGFATTGEVTILHADLFVKVTAEADGDNQDHYGLKFPD